eukprot:COSAG02_NODE_804_length_16991_cov_2.687840_2_plen_1089_part_00
MSQWEKQGHVDKKPPMEEPVHIWKTCAWRCCPFVRKCLTLVLMYRDLLQGMDGSDYLVQLTVNQPHAGYKAGKTIQLKCQYHHTHTNVVVTIQNFQRYGPWLEQQLLSPGNTKKKGWLDRIFDREEYQSTAKVTLEETVIPHGCRHADATMVIATIRDNRVKARYDHALQDVEQTCEALKKYFDRTENRDECIRQFAFCLFFYAAMREALQAIDQRGRRDKFEAAQEKLDDVLKFLKRVLLESTDSRAALRKALAECDIEYCQQMLLTKHMGKVVLPLSDLQVTSKPARLSRANDWEMFFTMLLLESTVLLRLQALQAPGPHGQLAGLAVEDIARRVKPFRNTVSTQVSADQLGDLVATAAAEGCFDIVRFCPETFAYIALKIYSFPTVVRPADGHAQTMDVAEFFELATKCNMATPEVLDAIRPELVRNSKGRAEVALPFLLEFNRVLRRGVHDMSPELQRETDQLFVSYFEGFMPRHDFLSDSIYNLYSPLLESGQVGDLMASLFEAIMQRVHAEPPQLVHITDVLSKQIVPDHPLKHDHLIQHLLLEFFASRPGPVRRSAEYRLAQYQRDILKVLALLQHNWSLDFSGQGEMIVSKVASDVLQLRSTNAAYDYGGEGGERLAVICEVIKDPNFGTLVHSVAVPQAHGQVDGSLDAVIDRLEIRSVFTGPVLKKLLGNAAPADECVKWDQAVPSPALPTTYVVWQQICERLGRNVSAQPAVDRLKLLGSLATSGQEQIFYASTSGHPNLLACTMFYSTVLLSPILSAATFLQTDVPRWMNLIKGDYFPLISRAIEIFRQGMNKCEHPLAKQYLAPVADVEEAIGDGEYGMRNAFEKQDLSTGELQRLNEILQVDTIGGATGRVVGIEQREIIQVLHRVDADLKRLQQAKQVVQFLGTLNVERGRDEQDLARLIAESERRPIGDITLFARDFDEKYKTGVESLGDKLYGLVAHFQREKSVIFDATVDTLRKSEAIGIGSCDVERAKEFMESVDKQLFDVLARTVTVDKLRPILPALQNWYALPPRLSYTRLLCMSRILVSAPRARAFSVACISARNHPFEGVPAAYSRRCLHQELYTWSLPHRLHLL